VEAVPLSFDEIRDWEQFQELVAEFFRTCKTDGSLNVTEVEAMVSGRGPDGGCDIEVILRLHDGIKPFHRKWIVQCKFHSDTVGLPEMASGSIPDLLHQYNADGYLLICRNSLSARLTDQLKALAQGCRHGRHYCWWSGDEFIKQLRSKPTLIEHFFPKYHLFILERERTKLPPTP
jgi:hypothetical protein